MISNWISCLFWLCFLVFWLWQTSFKSQHHHYGHFAMVVVVDIITSDRKLAEPCCFFVYFVFRLQNIVCARFLNTIAQVDWIKSNELMCDWVTFSFHRFTLSSSSSVRHPFHPHTDDRFLIYFTPTLISFQSTTNPICLDQRSVSPKSHSTFELLFPNAAIKELIIVLHDRISLLTYSVSIFFWQK